MISYCVSLLFLGKLSAEDIREKKISIFKVLLFALAGISYRLITGDFSWQGIGGSLFPGSILLMLALLTNESIGYGDGATVLALGLWMGGWFTGMAVIFGILLSGIWGVICIFRSRNEPIAFIPFLLLGMEVALIYA